MVLMEHRPQFLASFSPLKNTHTHTCLPHQRWLLPYFLTALLSSNTTRHWHVCEKCPHTSNMQSDWRTHVSYEKSRHRRWCLRGRRFPNPVRRELPSPARRCPLHSEKLGPYCACTHTHTHTVFRTDVTAVLNEKYPSMLLHQFSQLCSLHICFPCRYLAGLWYWHRKSKRSSGIGTRLSFGSMVQKGKFSAAAWLFVSTLKKVDLLKTTWRQSTELAVGQQTATEQMMSLVFGG